MVSIYFATKHAIYKASEDGTNKWQLEHINSPGDVRSLGIDPVKKRIYAGTFDNGLYASDNDGANWQRIGEETLYNRVMTLYVNETEHNDQFSVLWAGTEPSMLYQTEDGGDTWKDSPTLLDVPSELTWSFPPRPHTHHVRTIQPDMHHPERIFVGIELGGVMKSDDQGNSWEDRKTGSHHDSHSIKAHPFDEGRIYEAAGEGFAESKDSGVTWAPHNDGLGEYTYMVDIAIDPEDADTIIASVAKGPYTAYQPDKANTYLVRRTKGSDWTFINDGLPSPKGSSVFGLLTHHTTPQTFYAINNTGIYISTDSGVSFDKVEIEWPEPLTNERIHDSVLMMT